MKHSDYGALYLPHTHLRSSVAVGGRVCLGRCWLNITARNSTGVVHQWEIVWWCVCAVKAAGSNNHETWSTGPRGVNQNPGNRVSRSRHKYTSLTHSSVLIKTFVVSLIRHIMIYITWNDNSPGRLEVQSSVGILQEVRFRNRSFFKTHNKETNHLLFCQELFSGVYCFLSRKTWKWKTWKKSPQAPCESRTQGSPGVPIWQSGIVRMCSKFTYCVRLILFLVTLEEKLEMLCVLALPCVLHDNCLH